MPGTDERLMTGEELARQILSPDDRPEVKIWEYLAIGVDRVWLIDLQRRQARIHRSPEQVEILEISDTLRYDEILPGFALPLSELFRDYKCDGA